jgi:hypothetical protein
VDDPKGVTIRDLIVAIFRPKTALNQKVKAREAVKGSQKARMLVNSQTQLWALIISFSFTCSHLAMCSAVALCFNIIGIY